MGEVEHVVPERVVAGRVPRGEPLPRDLVQPRAAIVVAKPKNEPIDNLPVLTAQQGLRHRRELCRGQLEIRDLPDRLPIGEEEHRLDHPARRAKGRERS